MRWLSQNEMVGIGNFLATLVALDSEEAGQVEVSEELEAEEVEGAEGASRVGNFKKREAVPTEIDALTPMPCPPA